MVIWSQLIFCEGKKLEPELTGKAGLTELKAVIFFR